MSRLEALRSYTLSGAYAAFEEGHKGKLIPGHLADLVVLSEDLFAVPPEAIKDVRVLRTMVGGRWVYATSAPSP